MQESKGEALGARLRRLVDAHGATLAACALAVLWFFHLGYGETLDPRNIRWMLREDWAAYLWGFLFFRNAAWSFPLGNTPELFYPFGTSVGFTDANPWVALLFKALSPLLPLRFQFSGMWFLLCFVLQALFGARIARTLTDDKLQQALGGALFALTPVLPVRAPHIALCALFFVTAGLSYCLKPASAPDEARRTIVRVHVLAAWVAGTHGYLSVMLLALSVALYARLCFVDRLLSYRGLALSLASTLGVTLFVYWLFGYLGWKPADLTAEGFGQFSGDLTALVNPQGWSRFVPGLPHRPRQWEGFAYLGVGVLALVALRLAQLALAPSAIVRSARRLWPLFVVLALMWLYSLSSSVAYLGDEVLGLHALYAPAERLTGIFRSSGRFAWPLHLALVALALAGCAAVRPRWLARTLLAAALVAQWLELDPSRLSFARMPLDPLQHPVWSTVARDYKHLRLVPIHLLWVCRYDPHLVNRLSYEAYRRHLTFNSGNFMRKEPGVERLCEQGPEPGPLDPETVYVVDPAFVGTFRERNAVCGAIDGVLACVAGRPTPLAAVLQRGPV